MKKAVLRRREMPPVHADVPNLAPMVDVVMCILIFFMLGTSFALSEGFLPTQLPADVGPGGAAAVTVVPVVRISLLEEPTRPGGCRILVLDRDLADPSFKALQAYMVERRAAGADPTGRVVIGAEPGVQYQNVISAMDACVRAGFANLQFAINTGAARAAADAASNPR